MNGFFSQVWVPTPPRAPRPPTHTFVGPRDARTENSDRIPILTTYIRMIMAMSSRNLFSRFPGI